jgi:5-formyltetrahydrofolate cyclo-ligase
MAKTMATEKKYLRTILRESREALSAERVIALSAAVQARLIGTEFYRAAHAIVLYAAIDNEVATDPILADALRSLRTVYYPRVDPDSRSISLVQIRDPLGRAPGAFGVLEPAGARSIAPADLEAALICVPGLAFTPDGRRLGRGGGYYDRLLAQISPGETIAVGLAYSFQVLDLIPETQLDRRVDCVVTEFAVHSTAKRQFESASTSTFLSGPRIDRGGASRCPNF